MKWYFASRTKHKELIIGYSEKLTAVGEEVVSDWVYVENLLPYTSNVERAEKLSQEVVSSILVCDIFVLISDEGGTDMFVELGTALAKVTCKASSIRIYIIGEQGKRSLMQLHPAVIHIATIEDCLELEKIHLK